MPESERTDTDSAAIERKDSSRCLLFPFVLIMFVGGIVPIAIAWHFGALGIARGDDWAYLHSAFRFADTGEIDGNRWASMNLVGQLLIAAPAIRLVGQRIAALQVEIALLGVVGLLSVFDLAKQLLSPRRALLVAIVVAVGPMWASLSASFMTDVPGFALAMASLALGARGVRQENLRFGYVAASMAVGLLAYTVREYAIVAPIAVATSAVWTAFRSQRPRLRVALETLAALFAAAALFYSWRRHLPGFVSVPLHPPTLSSLRQTVRTDTQSLVLLGLLVSPVVALAQPTRFFRSAMERAPRITPVVGIVTAGLLVGETLHEWNSGRLIGPGNYVNPTFTGADVPILPKLVLALLALIGISSVVAMALAVVAAVSATRRSRGSPRNPASQIVALVMVGYVVVCAVPPAFGFPAFDRYIIPLVPLVGILILYLAEPHAPIAKRARVWPCIALVILAAFGGAYATTNASYDGANWSAARHAVNVAVDERRVDGGSVWNSYYAGHLSLRPAGACITVSEATIRINDEASAVAVRGIWSPTGARIWAVARQRRPC